MGSTGDQRKVHWVKWNELCQHKNQGSMGFKDLTTFNEAMLAKLAWQLLSDENSLFHKVFKARFFPRRSILEAKDSPSASYAWRSIPIGRNVIAKGALWRVGNGKQIKIWSDNWLPTRHNARITTLVIFGQEHSCVEVLIDPVQRKWRDEVVDHVFERAEVKVIKSIPLSSTSQPNAIVWPFTPSGRYSVQSGYRLLQDSSDAQQTPANDSDFWKNLWGMEVSSKVKNFVWRACKEALPTKQNLFRRKITTSTLCENCRVCDEDCAHAIFYCSKL